LPGDDEPQLAERKDRAKTEVLKKKGTDVGFQSENQGQPLTTQDTTKAQG